MKLSKHMLIMLVGCGLPLLLIFFAPALGISGNASFLILIILMFACHLFMPMHHGSRGKHDDHNQRNIESEAKKETVYKRHHY